MKLLKNITLITGLIISNLSFGQCYNDNCNDDTENDIAIPGCCTGNTTGMTWSGYGDFSCLNMGTPTNPDVWMSFIAPTTGNIQIVLDNITQSGPVGFVFFDHQNSDECNSLNSSGYAIGSDCVNLPGDGVGGTTSTTVVPFLVQAGERYWLLVTADVENGATPGTFTACISILPPPPPPPPAPGQDCPQAQIMCNGGDFTLGNLQLGDGAIEENWGCITNENNSQWYTFTASESGTITLNVNPSSNYTMANCAGGPSSIECTGAGDDYDFLLVNITTTGCASTAPVVGGSTVGCDFSGCTGNTGFGNTAASSFGLLPSSGSTANDMCNTDQCGGIGPSTNCAGTPQWNNTTPNLVAGQTYAFMIQNYTGSTGGITVEWGGTAVISPQAYQVEFDAILDQTDCEATLDLTFGTGIPNYTYVWDFGDGTTSIGADPGSHYYGTPGTYIVELTMTDALGCSHNFQRIIDVAICTPIPLPIELKDFNATVYGANVKVEWTATSQLNNDYYVVQRTNNIDENWTDVQRVLGAGTTQDEMSYSIVDERPFYGLSYYRLNQIDYNGEIKYSPIRSVKFLDNARVVKIVNILGQLVSSEYKGVVYHIYSDGTSKTVIQ